ncbi:MAG: hypothetical protein ACLFMX_02165 [Halobacteriales archaeon]
MVGSRTATALIGLLASVVISALLWWHLGTVVFFLFVPFVPFVLRGRRGRPPGWSCPRCGFRSADPDFEYCPRDGTPLERDDDGLR